MNTTLALIVGFAALALIIAALPPISGRAKHEPCPSELEGRIPKLSPPPPWIKPTNSPPPIHVTTLTTVEWIDGAYQIVETKVVP